MMTMQWWDIAPLGWENILVCLVCGTLVGLERQLRGKPVGIRTSSLIVLGTYCFLAIGAAVSPQGADQARVLGQLITGVGFLGAGVMMTRDGQVLGVTSAAAIWMLAALGALIGMDMLHQALLLTGVTPGKDIGLIGEGGRSRHRADRRQGIRARRRTHAAEIHPPRDHDSRIRGLRPHKGHAAFAAGHIRKRCRLTYRGECPARPDHPQITG